MTPQRIATGGLPSRSLTSAAASALVPSSLHQAAALRRAVAQAAEERRFGRLGPKTLGARLRKVEEQIYKSCDTDHGGLIVMLPSPAVVWLFWFFVWEVEGRSIRAATPTTVSWGCCALLLIRLKLFVAVSTSRG